MESVCGRILIADSDGHARYVASNALRRAGYDVCEAATAKEALIEALEDRPILVILDVDLPGMSGYDVCRVLRNEYGKALPIVLVSGPPTPVLLRLARVLAGSDDAIVGTASPRELLSLVAGP